MADVVKQLPHRTWSDVRDLWISHLPSVDFDKLYPEPTLWELPEAREKLFPTQEEMAFIPGVRESVFREAILLSRKFTYCRKVAWEASHQGFPTWSIIAAYDACFFGAKALCCFLGIASLDRDSRWFLDVLAFQSVKIGKRRQNVPILRAYDLKRRLSHDLLWRMTARLIRTLSLPSPQDDILKEAISFDFDSISKLRNSIIYNGGFWISKTEISHCDLVKQLSDLDLINALNEGTVTQYTQCRYFDLARRLGDLLVCFLDSMSDLAPNLNSEKDALSQWRPCSSI